MRKIKYKNGFWYHIFNRGVDKRNIFNDRFDYFRFYNSLRKFNCEQNVRWFEFFNKKKNSKKVNSDFMFDFSGNFVDIICFCFNKNHYHILMKQNTDNGISKYMHKLDMGYAKYFNKRNNRSGSLFQGTYKAVYVKTLEQLIYLSCYINGNFEIHGLGKSDVWPWSSYDFYFKNVDNNFLSNNIILANFKSLDAYRDYLNEVIKTSRKIKKVSRELLLE